MIKKSAFLIFGCALACTACGGGDGGTGTERSCVVNGGADCFDLPTEVLTKEDGSPADFDCPAEAVKTLAMDVTVSGSVLDFQDQDETVRDATVAAFAFEDWGFATPLVSDVSAGDGSFSVTIPTGQKNQINWRVTSEDALDTYALNLDIDETMATNSDDRLLVAKSTARALSGFVGVDRTPGLAVVVPIALDCDGDQVGNAITTLSSTSSVGDVAPTHVPGSQVYYFSNLELPTFRSIQQQTNDDGFSVIIEIPPRTSKADPYYMQVWGFTTAADLAAGESGLKLLSETQTLALADSVVAADMRPGN